MNQLFYLALPMLLATSALQAEPVPIGYIDMQVVLDESKQGRQARESLKERFEGPQAELAEEEQSIRKLQQDLARDEALMSQAELDKRKAEIRERIGTFEQRAAQLQRELMQEQAKLSNDILEPAEEIIAAVAKDKKVKAIFERRQSGLLFVDEGLDLTAEVIKRLDAKAK